MVWINKHDPPPPLPEGWAWHEEHRCGAEALWEEVEAHATAAAATVEIKEGQGGVGAAVSSTEGGEAAVFERWAGQQLFVIMGAGTSVQVRI